MCGAMKWSALSKWRYRMPDLTQLKEYAVPIVIVLFVIYKHYGAAIAAKLSNLKDSAAGLVGKVDSDKVVTALLVGAAGYMLWQGQQPGQENPGNHTVYMEDVPDVVLSKVDYAWAMNRANVFDELVAKAAEFEGSGDAAKWFAEQTKKAQLEAYKPFDAWIFHRTGKSEDGDRYDPEAVAKTAAEFAKALRARWGE